LPFLAHFRRKAGGRIEDTGLSGQVPGFVVKIVRIAVSTGI
jgi:hypothetical protein